MGGKVEMMIKGQVCCLRKWGNKKIITLFNLKIVLKGS